MIYDKMIYDKIIWSRGTKGYYRNRKHGQFHRYIWEKHNECKIPEGYIIHHKNEDKEDNDPSNLILMTHGEHSSLHHTGLKHNEETKKKISEAVRNRPSISQETRDKLSIANMGHSVSLETKQKISKGNRGKTFSDEHRAKLSEARKGKVSPRKIIPTTEMIEDALLMSKKLWIDKYKYSSGIWDKLRKTYGR